MAGSPGFKLSEYCSVDRMDGWTPIRPSAPYAFLTSLTSFVNELLASPNSMLVAGA